MTLPNQGFIKGYFNKFFVKCTTLSYEPVGLYIIDNLLDKGVAC